MKLTLLENIGKLHNLDANELAVCSAIFSFSRGGRGWFGSYPALALLLPFLISETTVKRVIKRLVELNLIEKRGKAFFVTELCINEETNCPSDKVKLTPEQGQSDTPTGSNCSKNKVKSTHIYNKDIYKDNNTINLACDKSAQQETSSDEYNFNVFKSVFNKATDNQALWTNREKACQQKWQEKSLQERAQILRWLEKKGSNENNPIFFLSNFSMPEPTNYAGQEFPKGRTFYRVPLPDKKFAYYTAEDVEDFGISNATLFMTT